MILFVLIYLNKNVNACVCLDLVFLHHQPNRLYLFAMEPSARLYICKWLLFISLFYLCLVVRVFSLSMELKSIWDDDKTWCCWLLFFILSLLFVCFFGNNHLKNYIKPNALKCMKLIWINPRSDCHYSNMLSLQQFPNERHTERK